MLSPYRTNPNNTNKRTKNAKNTNFDKNSHRDHDLERPQMTSNDLKTTQTDTKSNKKNKNVLKLDLCNRILKLTINISMKFLIIMLKELLFV